MSNSRLEIVDDELIGFVSACLISGAINSKELNLWAEDVLAKNSLSDIPDYILDLISFNAPSFKIYKIIGFVPNAKDLPEGSLEFSGLAALRGRLSSNTDVDIFQALSALHKRPDIVERFKQVFPFLDLPSEVIKP